jgi:uncharacterized membrane protein (DUF373 family)
MMDRKNIKKKEEKDLELIVLIFKIFENVVSICLSLLVGTIIILSLTALFRETYELILPTFVPNHHTVSFGSYQKLFGKVMVVIISVEFLKTILKVIQKHQIDTIVQDVTLISGLAVGHELIIMDFDEHGAQSIFALGALLIGIGIFYHLVKTNGNATHLLSFLPKKRNK